ncbi:dihydroorotate dehydrogenase electron transfer subunit [Lacrimispora xylanisolvens]|jgi:dihydroorotate dehydrogenase electron transfer subunit|uniref:Dihydroorotate dehydrogenase B (NAD(+)), electron transfer subunit n=1 Tax=Lacrimispora xylanisolvens TaxID=384636 RepID=A0A2S6HMS4_9FIRM|nr:dihydroorotate dehydrogenase electron transfer subunit [Hungatella xylanolytica]MBE5986928.1 dihydroorotate dehydrogenase electron transfer subunit [Paenibacillaceae bacterium]PPK78663.1 dihydroorotate dehydrogenase electron transfer subunit [Hungatella xylanolytica]
MGKIKITASVASQVMLSDGVYSMWIDAKEITDQSMPGQFISVYTGDSSKLLPRPISICETDREKGLLRIVYRIAGKGTDEFSRYQTGDPVIIMGPLGNGFPLEAGNSGKKALLIGGGIGIPPMLELAKNLSCTKQMVLGYRDELFLNEEFLPYGDTFLATENGTAGTKGNVMDAIREHGLQSDVIFACGPTPMLKSLRAYALEHHIECYLSLEEKMACGIGACLACVCKSSEKDDHSMVHNKRVCKDGPVFKAEEVEF